MTITIEDIIDSGAKSIAKAIEWLSVETENEFASGSIWGKNDVYEAAAMALTDDYGAAIYIDSSDGRAATKRKERIVWSAKSVVEIELPDPTSAIYYPEAAAVLIATATHYGTSPKAVKAFQVALAKAVAQAEAEELVEVED